MPYVSGLLRDEKVTNDEGAIGHVDKVSRQKKPGSSGGGDSNGAAAAFRAHLNLYVEKLDVHCNYADALPAILVNNTVALNRYILGWLITHSLT